MNAICRPSKLEVAAWMRERRSAGCPPPDGAQIRQALRWVVAPTLEQRTGHDTDPEARVPIPERILL